MTVPRDYSCIFLSYDEPAADYHYDELKKSWPEALRVHGVKGIDAAHKKCVEAATTDRFFIIDGDNLINPNFLNQSLPQGFDDSPNTVFSWGSLNNVNGLFYGNGGVKSWTRDLLSSVESHEHAKEEKFLVDFCYGIQYQPVDFGASFLWISGSAYQAFRAGFREGVKFCLCEGRRLPIDTFPLSIADTNYSRLLIWCTVGRDKDFGRWAMLGARMGIYLTMKEESFDPLLINDYSALRVFWENAVLPECEVSTAVEFDPTHDIKLEPKLLDFGRALKQELNVNILELEDESLRFFRHTFVNPSRSPELQF